jgi:hypothetical protein
MCGTLVNAVEVDGVELADVNVGVQNTRHIPAWIKTVWVKVFVQITIVTFSCRSA